MKELRARKELTAKELGEHMTAKGFRWDRFTVANLESGKRQNVTVQELLALARVLDVAPVHLLVPIDDRPFQAIPEETHGADRVRAWIRGQAPLPGTKREGLRTFRAEVPLEELEPRSKAELFDLMGSWGAVDVEAEKRRDPKSWEGEDGEGR